MQIASSPSCFLHCGGRGFPISTTYRGVLFQYSKSSSRNAVPSVAPSVCDLKTCNFKDDFGYSGGARAVGFPGRVCLGQRAGRTLLIARASAKDQAWPSRWGAFKQLAVRYLPFLQYSEILKRTMVSILMLAIIRCGHFIPIPGVDTQRLPNIDMALTEGERMIKALYGQAQDIPASIFDLGIGPYINASILMTVALSLPASILPLPFFERLREAKKEGKGGEALINTYINRLALAFAIYTALLRAHELAPFALFTKWFVAKTALALIAGASIIQFCASTITHHGVGNGTTLVICTGIVSEYAETLHQVLTGLEAATFAAWKLILMGAGYLSLVLFSVYLSSTELRLPIIQYSTTVSDPNKPGAGNDLFLQARQMMERKAAESRSQGPYFPILLNSSGMMPMIFAGALYFGLLPKAAELVGMYGLANAIYSVQSTFLGLVFYGLLVFCMEFVPVGGVNPPEVAEYFNMINVGIKGVAPGYNTEVYLRQQLLRSKFWGGLALGGLAIMAHVFDAICLNVMGTTLATTSLIIIVGAVLQTARQVESLMEGPRLQQRLDQERIVIQSLSRT